MSAVDVGDRMVEASESGDFEALRTLLAPDAVIWRSDLGAMGRERFVETVRRLRDRVGPWHYRARRLHATSTAFVEQHVVAFGGAQFPDVVVCVVAEVDDGDVIVRLDEYVTTGRSDWERGQA